MKVIGQSRSHRNNKGGNSPFPQCKTSIGNKSGSKSMGFSDMLGSSYSHIRYISTEYESSSYMKVIGQSRGHRNNKGGNSPFPQCKTSIGNKSGSKSMGFSDMADLML